MRQRRAQSFETVRKVALRPLALPNEHGGWAFLLEPVVLGLIVAPSLAGGLIGVAALAAFLARHPLRLAAADALRGRRYPRTRICFLLGLGYAGLAAACLIAAATIGHRAALAALGLGGLAAGLQFAFDAWNLGRELTAELAGAFAGTFVAAAIVLAGGGGVAIAAAVAALMAARAIPAVIFIRSLLRGRGRVPSLLLHTAAVVVAVTLWSRWLAPPAAIVAMALLFVRAAFTSRTTSAKTVGTRELLFGALVVLSIGLGYGR